MNNWVDWKNIERYRGLETPLMSEEFRKRIRNILDDIIDKIGDAELYHYLEYAVLAMEQSATLVINSRNCLSKYDALYYVEDDKGNGSVVFQDDATQFKKHRYIGVLIDIVDEGRQYWIWEEDYEELARKNMQSSEKKDGFKDKRLMVLYND